MGIGPMMIDSQTMSTHLACTDGSPDNSFVDLHALKFVMPAGEFSRHLDEHFPRRAAMTRIPT
jgi:hypothetical protein